MQRGAAETPPSPKRRRARSSPSSPVAVELYGGEALVEHGERRDHDRGAEEAPVERRQHAKPAPAQRPEEGQERRRRLERGYDDGLVSVITPVRDGAAYLGEALASVAAQTHLSRGEGKIEVCVYDDGSTDGTRQVLAAASAPGGPLHDAGVALRVAGSAPGSAARGCGYGRNRALELAAGAWLCFLDADDVCEPERVSRQLAEARAHPGALVGCRVHRPGGDTPRYVAWLNGMSQAQLVTQRLRETTLAMPTWFCARAVVDRAGGFAEARPNEAEDLMMLYAHVAGGGDLRRVDGPPLLMYRYHAASVTGQRGVPKERIWELRVAELERVLLSEPRWRRGFCIWNAGREGRRLYRALRPELRDLVREFCDVDEKKLALGYYDDHATGSERRIPVVHFSRATPPLLLCVKYDLAGDGAFEKNLASLNLTEGVDFLHFS